MTMQLLAVPEPLVGISDLRLCPAGCLGGFQADEFIPVEGSELVRVVGPPCETCGGSGYDPSVFEGCCGDDEHRAVITFEDDGCGFTPGRGAA